MAEYGSGPCDLDSESLCKIFVGGIPKSVTTDDLGNYFGQFGEIKDHIVITDKETSTSRGFGFVTFMNSDSVETILDENNSISHELGGKSADIKRAMPREFGDEDKPLVTKLFVGGLSKDCDEAGLQGYLEDRHSKAKCGHITKVEVKRDRDSNAHKGFAFVECSTTHLVDRIAIAERNCTISGKATTIKKALPQGSAPAAGGRGGRGAPRGAPQGSSRGGSGGRGGYGGRGGFGRGAGGYGQQQQGGYGGGYGGQQQSYGSAPSYGGQQSYGGYGGY